jgi:hypothetical protein
MAYITEKLKALSEKSLSSRRETQVVVVSFKDGNDQLENSLCRGSLAWFGRQTHNLERKGTRRPNPEVAGSNPAPGTIFSLISAFLY